MARLNNEISKERIKTLIKEKCDGSQTKFAELCGIGKYSVSQYVHGYNSPGNVSAIKISRAFGVDPLWVMGEPDAPMYKENIKQSVEMTDHEEDIFRKYRMLSPHFRDAVDNMIVTLYDSMRNADAMIFNQKVNDHED